MTDAAHGDEHVQAVERELARTLARARARARARETEALEGELKHALGRAQKLHLERQMEWVRELDQVQKRVATQDTEATLRRTTMIEISLWTKNPSLQTTMLIDEATYSGYARQLVPETGLGAVEFPLSTDIPFARQSLGWFAARKEGKDTLSWWGPIVPPMLIAAPNTQPVVTMQEKPAGFSWGPPRMPPPG